MTKINNNTIKLSHFYFFLLFYFFITDLSSLSFSTCSQHRMQAFLFTILSVLLTFSSLKMQNCSPRRQMAQQWPPSMDPSCTITDKSRYLILPNTSCQLQVTGSLFLTFPLFPFLNRLSCMIKYLGYFEMWSCFSASRISSH